MLLKGYLLMPTRFLFLASAFKFYLTSANVETFCPPQHSIMEAAAALTSVTDMVILTHIPFASNDAKTVSVIFLGEQRKSKE